MTVHAISFSLYCLSLVLFLESYFVWMNQRSKGKVTERAVRQMFIIWSIVCYTNFAAQLCLVWIFNGFKAKRRDSNEQGREQSVQALTQEGDDVERLSHLETDNNYRSKQDSRNSGMEFDEPHFCMEYDDEDEENPLMRHSVLNVSLFLSTVANEDDLKA